MFDAIIVGGSYAGLSAALTLGRSRRQVLVLDSGQPCNRFTHAAHNFLSRDGIAPDELSAIAREQLSTYPSVHFQSDTVTQINPQDDSFTVATLGGEVHTARKVLLATGLKDNLPPISGIEAYWGRSVFHCPYCDGWELRDQAIVVYGPEQKALHLTKLLSQWTAHLSLCTNAEWAISESDRQRLTKHGIAIIDTPIAQVAGAEGQIEALHFSDGSTLPCRAMFITPQSVQGSDFAADLGCAMTEHNLVQVDLLGRSSVNGIYAAGDLAQPFRSLSAAVAQGSAAGAGINFDLINEDFQ